MPCLRCGPRRCGLPSAWATTTSVLSNRDATPTSSRCAPTDLGDLSAFVTDRRMVVKGGDVVYQA